MALEEIELKTKGYTPTPEIQGLITEANRRIDALFESAENKRYPQYLPSDPYLFSAAISDLTKRDLPMGKVFCEWGSGYGLAACIAATLGYDSFGIEIEPVLVEHSQKLASDLGIPVKILCTSYLPEGLDSYTASDGEELIQSDLITYDGRRFEFCYEGMEMDTTEIDVFFVYPWPGDQEFMQQLFEAVAVEGAILVAIHAEGEVYAFRKVQGDS